MRKISTCFMVAFFASICLIHSSTASAATCPILRATSWYNVITAGGYRLVFDDHDPPGPHGHAFVSDQPFKIIARDGKSCMAADQVDIVAMPIFLVDKNYLDIPTYSGSDAYIYVVDARNCHTLWQSPDIQDDWKSTTTGFTLPGLGWLVLGPGCLPMTLIRAPTTAKP